MAEEPYNDDPNPVSAQVWQERLIEYRRLIEDEWKKECDNTDKLYARERSDSADREYAIFWSNLEILKTSVYARPPVPVVAPRFKQPDKIASAASETLERCAITTFEQKDLDGCMKNVRDELLRYGRGTAWARLDTKNGYECVEFDFISSDDFAHDPARSYGEVKWKARRGWYTRAEGRERFNEYLAQYDKTFDDVPIKKRDENATVERSDDQAPVWEIWDKDSNQVIFINEETDCPLDVQAPWLDLSSFWPCPKPAYGTLKPKTLKPVPDIKQYADQIEEINTYTARIAALSENLRMKGFYPAGGGEISEAIEAAIKTTDNRAILVPVSSWAAFGGIKPGDLIVWLPIKEVGDVIRGLVELRRVVIDDVYQITGISDILRGQTDADETAAAQQLKSQWGSIRIRDKQNELARFARDMTRIAGEIIAENFSDETVLAMSQVNLPSQEMKDQAQQAMTQAQEAGQQPPPELTKVVQSPSFEEVMAFLRDDRARGFAIEIETDSTILPDENAEKQRRVEFVTAIGSLIQQAVPLAIQAPMLAPFIGETLKFSAQGFRAGRTMEGAIDDLVAAISAPRPQQPDPEQAKAEAELALEKQKADQEMALKDREFEHKRQLAEREFQHKTMMDNANMAREAENAQLQAAMQRETMMRDGEMKMEIENRRLDNDRKTAMRGIRVNANIERSKNNLPEILDSDEEEMMRQMDEKSAAFAQQGAALVQQVSAQIEQLAQQMAAQSQQIAQQMAMQSQQMMAGLQQLGKLVVDSSNGSQAASTQAMAEMMTLMKAPRRVTRDKNNRVVGVETVLN